MKMRKKWAVLLSAVIAAVFLGGCVSGKSGTRETAVEEKEQENGGNKVQVGFSVDSFVLERWTRDRDVFIATARELGAEVNVQDAGGEAEEQISQIRYLIQKKMDVIAVVARDCRALAEVLQEARDAGIAVISYDRLINDGGSSLYISFDNREVGVLMAESMIEAIPEGGDIFMIQGSSDDNNIYEIQEGFDETVKGSGLQVVYTANCEAWEAEQAVQYVEDGLKRYPDVKGIMCGNDEIASQVVRVLAENRKAGEVIVVGQDGDVAACQRIVEGTQYMTAFKAVENEARLAAEYAVRLGKGEELSELKDKVNDGSYEVLSRILSPVAVTKENMDEVVIDGGYHQREDVYLNVDR